MDYIIKVYNSLHAYEVYDFIEVEDVWVGKKNVMKVANELLKDYQVVKVESIDQEEIEVLVAKPIEIARDRLVMTLDSECVNVYIDNGDDADPTHVVYWHFEEWEEDSSIVPSIYNAVDMFHRNPQNLLNRLKLNYLLVD